MDRCRALRELSGSGVTYTYDSTGVPIEAKVSIRIRLQTREVVRTMLVQREAPQDVLLGTDLLGSLGFHLIRQPEDSARQSKLARNASEEELITYTVKLLRAIKLPARHARLVDVQVRSSRRTSADGSTLAIWRDIWQS